MKRFIAVPMGLVLLSMLLVGLIAVPPAMAVYRVGDHVNDFTLPNHQGQDVSLYNYQDRIVLLAFWFAS
jgi:cytochrome oxidase Cu insertion factor (SCO1/SenC/PrrC family)